MPEPPVLMEKQGEVMTLVMNRPKTLNAFQSDLLEGLSTGLSAAGWDDACRVVVIEGAGGHFCAGADISFFRAHHPPDVWLAGLRAFGELILSIRRLPKPVVAKVRGAAVGGGINLALAADFTVCADDALLREVFVHLGCVLDGGGSWFLPRLVGPAKARELAMLGDEFRGVDAARMGLVYKSVPAKDLDAEVAALAGRLARRPPAALAAIKANLEAAMDMPLEQALAREAYSQALAVQTDEHRAAADRVFTALGLKE